LKATGATATAIAAVGMVGATLILKHDDGLTGKS